MIKSIKRIITISICIFIIIAPLVCDYNTFSYADDDYWSIVTDNSITTTIWNKYLKSRGYTTTTTPTSIYTEFTYSQLEQLCAKKGITVSELNAQLKYHYDTTSGKYTFYLSKAVLRMLNDIYEALLTDTNIQPNSYKVIYSGKYYKSPSGNICTCFVLQPNKIVNFNDNRLNFYQHYAYYGSTFLHSGSYIAAHYGDTLQYPIYGTTVFNYSTGRTTYQSNLGWHNYIYYLNSTNNLIYCDDGFYSGYDCIVYNPTTQKYTAATFIDANEFNSSHELIQRKIIISPLVDIPDRNINSNNTGDGEARGNRGPAKNPYDDDKDYTISDDDDPDPVNPPATQQPVPPDSVLPNPENPTINPGNPDFNFQMPDINIDWNLPFDINNMPFPFSIPFDIKNFLEILDSEPIAPSYEFDFYILDNHIEYEIDLSQFDDAMEIIRNIELAGYCIFLIISTRALFHIY